MICPKCKEKLKWHGEHSFEDYGMFYSEGIVGSYACGNKECDVDEVMICTPYDI